MILFDVNETLLDLAALDIPFERAFGAAEVRSAWFTEVLRLALLTTITGPYKDFGEIGAAALDDLAARREVHLSESDRSAILDGVMSLPPYPEVPDSLERLRDAGHRLAALTNSPLEAAEAKLKHAGLYDVFEQVLSADRVRRLKPAPEPYRMAAEALGVAPGDIRLVAAHDWDVAGALRAGCRAAFVARPGKRLNPLMEQPEIVGADLSEVAEQILGQ